MNNDISGVDYWQVYLGLVKYFQVFISLYYRLVEPIELSTSGKVLA